MGSSSSGCCGTESQHGYINMNPRIRSRRMHYSSMRSISFTLDDGVTLNDVEDTDVSCNEIDTISLRDIMKTNKGYNILMKYLEKSLSSENLLYITEAVKFMNYISLKNNITASTFQLQLNYDQICLPESLINNDINDKIDIIGLFNKLCDKYILVQSEFEINISYKNRRNLVKLYQKLNTDGNDNIIDRESIQKMYDRLCSALGDVYANLNDSYSHFIQSELYVNWYKMNIETINEDLMS